MSNPFSDIIRHTATPSRLTAASARDALSTQSSDTSEEDPLSVLKEEQRDDALQSNEVTTTPPIGEKKKKQRSKLRMSLSPSCLEHNPLRAHGPSLSTARQRRPPYNNSNNSNSISDNSGEGAAEEAREYTTAEIERVLRAVKEIQSVVKDFDATLLLQKIGYFESRLHLESDEFLEEEEDELSDISCVSSDHDDEREREKERATNEPSERLTSHSDGSAETDTTQISSLTGEEKTQTTEEKRDLEDKEKTEEKETATHDSDFSQRDSLRMNNNSSPLPARRDLDAPLPSVPAPVMTPHPHTPTVSFASPTGTLSLSRSHPGQRFLTPRATQRMNILLEQDNEQEDDENKENEELKAIVAHTHTQPETEKVTAESVNRRETLSRARSCPVSSHLDNESSPLCVSPSHSPTASRRPSMRPSLSLSAREEKERVRSGGFSRATATMPLLQRSNTLCPLTFSQYLSRSQPLSLAQTLSLTQTLPHSSVRYSVGLNLLGMKTFNDPLSLSISHSNPSSHALSGLDTNESLAGTGGRMFSPLPSTRSVYGPILSPQRFTFDVSDTTFVSVPQRDERERESERYRDSLRKEQEKENKLFAEFSVIGVSASTLRGEDSFSFSAAQSAEVLGVYPALSPDESLIVDNIHEYVFPQGCQLALCSEREWQRRHKSHAFSPHHKLLQFTDSAGRVFHTYALVVSERVREPTPELVEKLWKLQEMHLAADTITRYFRSYMARRRRERLYSQDSRVSLLQEPTGTVGSASETNETSKSKRPGYRVRQIVSSIRNKLVGKKKDTSSTDKKRDKDDAPFTPADERFHQATSSRVTSTRESQQRKKRSYSAPDYTALLNENEREKLRDLREKMTSKEAGDESSFATRTNSMASSSSFLTSELGDRIPPSASQSRSFLLSPALSFSSLCLLRRESSEGLERVVVQQRAYCILSAAPLPVLFFKALQAIVDIQEKHHDTRDVTAASTTSTDEHSLPLACSRFIIKFLSFLRGHNAADLTAQLNAGNVNLPCAPLIPSLVIPSRSPNLAEWTVGMLFSFLPVDVILRVHSLLLLEKSVVIVGTDSTLVSMVATAFVHLLSPLKWAGIFVPLLPPLAQEVLDAPVPFIIGADLRGVYDNIDGRTRRPLLPISSSASLLYLDDFLHFPHLYSAVQKQRTRTFSDHASADPVTDSSTSGANTSATSTASATPLHIEIPSESVACDQLFFEAASADDLDAELAAFTRQPEENALLRPLLQRLQSLVRRFQWSCETCGLMQSSRFANLWAWDSLGGSSLLQQGRQMPTSYNENSSSSGSNSFRQIPSHPPLRRQYSPGEHDLQWWRVHSHNSTSASTSHVMPHAVFATCALMDLDPVIYEPVRKMLQILQEYNQSYTAGVFSSSAAWQEICHEDCDTHGLVVNTEKILAPLRQRLAVQESLLNTQMFALMLDGRCSSYFVQQRTRRFIYDWIVFRLHKKRNKRLSGRIGIALSPSLKRNRRIPFFF